MSENKLPLIINLISGPGAGKSTCAAGIFYFLKCAGVNCEMALEFAKDKVYEESFRTMDYQLYIFGKQFHKIWRLRDKVDVIITDSPLIISLYYNKEKSDEFDKLVLEQYNRFNNLMFFIERGTVYHPEGRLQTEDEAKSIDTEIKNLMEKYNIVYESVGQLEAVYKIVDIVKNYLN